MLPAVACGTRPWDRGFVTGTGSLGTAVAGITRAKALGVVHVKT